jgi:uncharacterized protein YecE (DUF72 family)
MPQRDGHYALVMPTRARRLLTTIAREMAEQLALFAPAEPPPAAKRSAVAPAVQDPATVALGRALPAPVHLGTSSWSFPGWAGIVYARGESETLLARAGLAAYSQHPVLRAAGIDRTFYGPVSAELLAAYAAQVPEDFRFLLKAPAAVTDAVLRNERGAPSAANPRHLDAGFAVETFVLPALTGLGTKLGPLVFQFPPQGRQAVREPARFAAQLGRFLAQLREALARQDLRQPLLAVELRDPELLTAELAAALAASDARYCFGVHARMPSIAAQAAAIDLAPGPLVARWNLHAGYAYEEARARYAPFDRLVEEDPDTRAALARLVVAALDAGQPVFVTANNKAEGCAPLSMVRLAEAILAGLAAGEGGGPDRQGRRAASR